MGTEKKERNRAIRYCENVEITPANFPIPKRYKPKVPIQEPTIKLPDQERRNVREWELNNPDIANQPLIDWDQSAPASYHSHTKHNNSVNALQTRSTIHPCITQPKITPTVNQLSNLNKPYSPNGNVANG